MPDGPSNREIADALERAAQGLEGRDENPFRVQAYRDAAGSVAAAERPVVEMLREGGADALRALPRIGPGLAAAIEEFVHTGRLRGAVDDPLRSVPGLGPTLAQRLRETLGIATLEDLEAAAHDGRLEGVEGFGRRRLKTLRETLNSMLSRSARRRARGLDARPGVDTVLAVDADYRERAGRGALRTIAPRRFNPEGRAWLPILRERRDGWNLTALFSNTAQAHRLGKTNDWVVVFFEQPGREGQATVVTETRGPLAGRRVVRGREAECAARYGIDLRRSG